MNIKWVDELPEKAKNISDGRRPSKYDGFAAELRKHPGQWAQWPTESLCVSSRRSTVAAINGPKDRRPNSFQDGKWQAAVRQSILYVRYLGEE